jgi:hypothetical protein
MESPIAMTGGRRQPFSAKWLGGRIIGASPLHAVVPKFPRCAAERQHIDLEL